MSEPIVRIAGHGDAKTMADIDARCFTSEAWPASEFASSMLAGFSRYYILELGDEAIGCAGCIMLSGIQGEISTMAVLPEYRGRGYSKLLMERITADCSEEDIDEIFLEVRPSNAPAIGLYKSFGFKEAGLRKRYYADGEDAVIMVRR